jgi:lactoylglutathione lyase
MVLYSHTIFYVKSIPDTISFYEKAFGIKPKFIHETKTYAELDTGDTALAFADETLGKENLPEGYQPNDRKHLPQGCEIVFSVVDVQKAYDRAVLAGAHPLSPPKLKPWGQTVAYVRDPHGILIEIASQLKKS